MLTWTYILCACLAASAVSYQPLHLRQGHQSAAIISRNSASFGADDWDAVVTAACDARLSSPDTASAPTGVCVCYNVPSFDNRTGSFSADLRLYMVSQPTGDFANISRNDIQVSVSYAGAAISHIHPRAATLKPSASSPVGRTIVPVLLQVYLFVGRANMSRLTVDMSSAAAISQLEALLMPTVTMTAVTAAGETVSTTVSANGAAFLVGQFSNIMLESAFARADDAVNRQTARLQAGQVAFVLPGMQLLVFPVGLLVTAAWLGIGLAAYGFGTYQRLQFRASFRSRLVAQQRTGRNR